MSDETRLDLNTLGFNSVELEEGQFVTDAIMVIRSSLPNGISRCTTLVTTGMDFVVARGMVSVLSDAVMDGGIFIVAEEDE